MIMYDKEESVVEACFQAYSFSADEKNIHKEIATESLVFVFICSKKEDVNFQRHILYKEQKSIAINREEVDNLI